MAMAEAYVLAQELERRGGDYRSAFAAYEKILKPATIKKQRDAVRISRFFVPSQTILCATTTALPKDVLQQSPHQVRA